jgi:hypothetical protein
MSPLSTVSVSGSRQRSASIQHTALMTICSPRTTWRRPSGKTTRPSRGTPPVITPRSCVTPCGVGADDRGIRLRPTDCCGGASRRGLDAAAHPGRPSSPLAGRTDSLPRRRERRFRTGVRVDKGHLSLPAELVDGPGQTGGNDTALSPESSLDLIGRDGRRRVRWQQSPPDHVLQTPGNVLMYFGPGRLCS